MIARHWPDWWWRKLGWDGWPTCWAAFDTETSGLRRTPDAGKPADLITEVGWVLAVNGRITDRGSWLVDWTRDPGTDSNWLRARLAGRDQQMRLDGRPSPTAYETLCERGADPKKVFAFVRDWFAELARAGVPVVAHNGYAFDEPMLGVSMAAAGVDRAWGLGEHHLVDSMGLELANERLLKGEPVGKLLPGPADTLKTYCKRLVAHKAGCQSKLDTHCFHKYGFEARGLPREQLHGSLADAHAVHLLMESWAAELTGGPAPGPVQPAPASPAARPTPPSPAVTCRRGVRIV